MSVTQSTPYPAAYTPALEAVGTMLSAVATADGQLQSCPTGSSPASPAWGAGSRQAGLLGPPRVGTEVWPAPRQRRD